MSVDLKSGEKIAALKQGIEGVTGETYTDLTEAVNGLKEKQYEAGKKAESDAFWDVFQNHGAEEGVTYINAFSYGKFTDDNYNPKYPIITTESTTGSDNLFYNAEGITDTKQPIYIRTSRVNATFSGARNMKNIPLLHIAERVGGFSNVFNSCESLETIQFAGVINANGLNLQWSTKLTHDSLMSIINALADKSADTSGTVWKVTIGDENRAKLTAEEIEIAEQKGWNIE